MQRLTSAQRRLVAAVLANDENATNEEMVEYFVTEAQIERETALEIVSKSRTNYQTRISPIEYEQ